jgi:K+-transporting ATPase ATPase C chain
MLLNLLEQMKIGFKLLCFFVILTGFIYPLSVTSVTQTLFSWKANGSLLEHNRAIVGSSLIGQAFTEPQYFWGRPSATDIFPYNAEGSHASNFARSNPALVERVKNRVEQINKSDRDNTLGIPVDLVTASASGLDPDISPLAALYQVHRVAQFRHLSDAELQAIVIKHIQERTLGILGEPRVNVLELNCELDILAQARLLTVTKNAAVSS